MRQFWRTLYNAQNMRRQIERGRYLAQLETGEHLADILSFGTTDDSVTAAAYYRELKRLYRLVCNERWESWRGAYEINKATRAELKKVKRYVDNPLKLRSKNGDVLAGR